MTPVSKRITIVLDDDVIEKLRKIQAEKIKKSSKSISFSSVINDKLKQHLK